MREKSNYGKPEVDNDANGKIMSGDEQTVVYQSAQLGL